MADLRLAELRGDQIVEFQANLTQTWHERDTPPRADLPWCPIERNHRMNFDLWHEEDIARRDDLGAERVRQAKRQIDRYNQARNDAMEQIDIWIQSQLQGIEGRGHLHSETPGMIIDRLSILSLKHYHMAEEAQRQSATLEHRQRCGAKVQVITVQISDLKDCLQDLLQQLAVGERRFKLYKQFKMYNDPSLNPQLYRQTSQVS